MKWNIKKIFYDSIEEIYVYKHFWLSDAQTDLLEAFVFGSNEIKVKMESKKKKKNNFFSIQIKCHDKTWEHDILTMFLFNLISQCLLAAIILL